MSSDDLDAFIDGQLDEAGRRQALNRLAHDPAAAARVMGDMALAHALRTSAFADCAEPSPQAMAAARRLQSGLASRRYWRWAARAAAGLAVFVVGYGLGEIDLRPPTQAPDFVSEALMSHRTAALRAVMASQPETPRYDPVEIRRATRIALPPRPPGWKVTDAQVYPSDEGPSVGLSFATGSGPVSLFAFRTGEDDPIGPTTVAGGETHVAYWQEDGQGFALIGDLPPAGLQAIAAQMAGADLPS
ncbi:anti-sigma factor family protein [Phenylobacterium sp.]|jgi:anti-sigma factor RsiW|uniref:anti-sigma factor family protein n=1 Tax=Phenylobacterium sp. TaxID=1871053 RepID=UPI003784B67C